MGITHQKGLGTIVYKTAHVRFHGRKWVHTRLSEKDRTQRLTRRNSGVSDGGWYHYPRSVPHVLETLRGLMSERQTLPLLGLGWMYSRRTQRACGTAMRLCVSLSRRRRGPAGLRDPFSSVEIVACMPCAQGLSACARHGRYHYPRRALCAVETPDGRLSKRLTCRFLRSGEQRSLRSAYFLRIYRIFCRQFQLQTLLRYGTISSTNWNFQISLCKQPLNLHHQLQFPDGC